MFYSTDVVVVVVLLLLRNVSSIIAPNIFIDAPAEHGEFPGIVSLLIERGPQQVMLCSGTHIDDRNILTAGHCVHNAQPDKVPIHKNQ